MTVKRSGGRIFGANLTAAEKTAMNRNTTVIIRSK
jgi:hypothetical protein